MCPGVAHANRPVTAAIIIPTYNAAPFLAATIRSALAQIRAASAIVVVDDGSTDGTSDICRSFGDAIISVRQENAGVAAARNFGVRHVAAEWLLFLDSDDLLLPHALDALLTTAQRERCGVAYGHVLARGRTAEEARLHGRPSAAGAPPQAAKANFKRSVITTPGAAIVRRDVFEEAGGFVPGYEPMEDRDFWVKCGMLTSFAFCDTVLLDKTYREGSAASQISRRIRNGLRAQLAFFDWCRERGFDTAFLGTSVAGVIDQAFREAIWRRRWEVIEPLRAQAQERGLRSFWYHRAGLQLWLWRLLRRAK